MTGDPHIDARLEPWRPEGRPDDRPDGLPDRLPAPGRERRARIALAVVVLVAAGIVIAYVAFAMVGPG